MLSKSFVKNVQPTDRVCRYNDGRDLYLEVVPAGGKWWRQKYRFAGEEKRISLGVYPDVSLAKERERREEARGLVADQKNPMEIRRAQKALLIENSCNSFMEISREWHGLFSPKWVPGYRHCILRRLEMDVFPWIGPRPIRTITAQELLVVLRRIEAPGTKDSAPRTLQDCGRVFRFDVATGRADRGHPALPRDSCEPLWIARACVVPTPGIPRPNGVCPAGPDAAAKLTCPFGSRVPSLAARATRP